jgi:hypothetical protein
MGWLCPGECASAGWALREGYQNGPFLRFWYLLALDAALSLGKLRISTMASSPMIAEETLRDFEYPQREAAFF